MGDRLQRLRQERRLSQRRLAQLADVTPAYVSKIESGERQPSLSVVRALAGALGVSASYLETGSEQDTRLDAARLVYALENCLSALERAAEIARRGLGELGQQQR